jgi:ferrochelatase
MEKAIKRGIVLMNLGSPESTEVKDVRRYLMEFLMDERVIDYPWLFRLMLVGGIIAPFRAPKSAEAYRRIWTDKGSPLIVYSDELKKVLDHEIEEPVEIGMRYGNPGVKAAFDRLLEKSPAIEEVIAIPMYPHYAMSSYETAVEYAKNIHQKGKYSFRLTTIKPYYNDPDYLLALSESMKPFLHDYDHILFSYHGVPRRHIIKGDITGSHCLQKPDCCSIPSAAHKQCYRHQCFETTRLVAANLGLPHGKYSQSFQSRLGREEWLQPYTAARLQELPSEGVKDLIVVCPAFVSDCLETLEEIAMEGKHIFLAAGGNSFRMIPCLNVHPLWVKAIKGWIDDYVHGDAAMVL